MFTTRLYCDWDFGIYYLLLWLVWLSRMKPPHPLRVDGALCDLLPLLCELASVPESGVGAESGVVLGYHQIV